MVQQKKDLLWAIECQPLTTAQMNEIKSQFHPSNTANVNITPYHIYSPNERVVGEWQEMINGVLKKKPVYEKRIDGLNITMSWYQQYQTQGTATFPISKSEIERIVYVYGYTQTYKTLSALSVDQDGNLIGYSSLPLESLVWRYTKTTDTWEEV